LWTWQEYAAAKLAEHQAAIVASKRPEVIASHRNGRPLPGEPDPYRDAYERERAKRLTALGLRP
jgi:hypothetical protein